MKKMLDMGRGISQWWYRKLKHLQVEVKWCNIQLQVLGNKSINSNRSMNMRKWLDSC